MRCWEARNTLVSLYWMTKGCLHFEHIKNIL
uniref:Uncharacterized protein n=1 Tax=Anguilla anguilla TaxID=7936 RepID=A0A0E9US25_ANGAN